MWICSDQNHPSTYNTITKDPELKQMVMEDLINFVMCKGYYRKTGTINHVKSLQLSTSSILTFMNMSSMELEMIQFLRDY